MKNEPLITVASLTAIVAALIGCLVEFGVPLTGGQETALLGLAAVVAPFAVAYFGRKRVTPTQTRTAHVAEGRRRRAAVDLEDGKIDVLLTLAIALGIALGWLLIQILQLIIRG